MAVSTRETSSFRMSVRTLLSEPASALWIGFTGLLLLMTIVALDAATSIQDVGTATGALRAESRQRDGALDQLRTDIHRSATVVREYLLDPDDGRAASQKAELEQIRARIEATLSGYAQKLPASERGAFNALKTHVEAYWSSVTPALQWDAATRRTRGANFFLTVLMPVRSDVVQLTRQVTALNDRDLDAREQSIQAVQAHFRQRVAVISALALVLGLALGAVSIGRVRHLERVARVHYMEIEQARQELRELSSRLVTAQEEERRKVSRELHDEVGQAMSAMLVELGRCEAAPNEAVRSERLASARGMAERCVGTVRNMALLLRPSMLDDLGLVAALRWQAREVTRRSGLKVKMIADEIVEDLPDSHRTCVYRVVQEALNNCARHAQATQAQVMVKRDRDGLSVSVRDDGAGFDPRTEKGMGLLGMEERVTRLGGRFSIESAPGAGTILSIRVPLAGAPQASLEDIA